MKLLLDQGLPRSATARLRAGGFDAAHSMEVAMSSCRSGYLLQGILKPFFSFGSPDCAAARSSSFATFV
jgi:hypothetical protein